MNKKNLLVVILLGIMGFSGIAYGQTTNSLFTQIGEWIGTGWITSGAVVAPNSLKSNLDYLYNNKAPIPQNCSGETSFLGWINGGWTCSQREAPRACSFNGTNIASGNSVTAYSSPEVAFNQTCQSETRSCTNGVLSGTFTASSCTPVEPGSCSFDGGEVSHGDSVTAFANSSVPFGQSCQSQTRTCSNGVLSGGYQSPTCAVVQPSACAFGDASIANGDSVTAYEFANVPFGETCQAQERSCSNGVLSGSYAASGCAVQPASTCVFNGATLQNGETVQAYSEDSVRFGQTCSAETRTCNNGVLSGTNTFGTCEVLRQDPITFFQRDFVDTSVEYGCWEENFLGGPEARAIETFTTFVPRDENGECPGWLSVKGTRTTSHLIDHPGIKYKTNGYEGIGHDGLSANSQTLAALCRLKGYNYVVGKAPEGRNGFRDLKTPENNRWVFGSGSKSFAVRTADNGLGFNGSKGYVTCSDRRVSTGTNTVGTGSIGSGEVSIDGDGSEFVSCGENIDFILGCEAPEFDGLD